MSDCNQFTIFNQTADLSKHDIHVITGDEPNFLPNFKQPLVRKILKIFQLIICHIELGRKIFGNRNRDAILIHGFSTEFLILTYIYSLFWTKNVYILTHHNIQQAFHSSIIRSVFKIYHAVGYKFIVNETSLILQNIGFDEKESSQHLSLLHPVVEIDTSIYLENNAEIDKLNSLRSDHKKIGIVGKIRQGKQFSKTLDRLLKLQEKLDFLLILGTDDLSTAIDLKSERLELVDTTTRDNYFAVLAACDIIVLNYEESKYLYRCSGVAADAISTRTYVVCPNFPLMSHQLNYPDRVGILYDNESDLETAIRQALQLVPAAENKAFESHYVERSIEHLALVLDQEIAARVEPN
jgi:hypothetical protein